MNGLKVAATIAWIWAVIYGVVGLSLGALAVQKYGVFSGQALFHVFIAALAIEFFQGAQGLKRGHPRARWVLLVVCALQMALPFAVPAPLMWAGAAVSVPIVALVVLNWRQPTGN
jgi:hypothetical protein